MVNRWGADIYIIILDSFWKSVTCLGWTIQVILVVYIAVDEYFCWYIVDLFCFGALDDVKVSLMLGMRLILSLMYS